MGILAADRKFLGEIGVLDSGMHIYGGENVELGLRVSLYFHLFLKDTENQCVIFLKALGPLVIVQSVG